MESAASGGNPSLGSHGCAYKSENIVLACDGIWDVMSSQEVVDKVRDMLLHGRPKEPPEGQGEVPLRALER